MNEYPPDAEMRSAGQQASYTSAKATSSPELGGLQPLLADGLLYCSCGNVCRARVNQQGVAYYVCDEGTSRRLRHAVKGVRADDIDRVVLAEAQAEIQRVLTLQISAREGTRQHLQQIGYERAQQQHRTAKLFQQYVDGVLSAPHFEQMNAFIHGRLTFLDDLEAKLLKQASLLCEQRDLAIDARERVKHLLQLAGDDCSRLLVKAVVERIDVELGRRGRLRLCFHFRCLSRNE